MSMKATLKQEACSDCLLFIWFLVYQLVSLIVLAIQHIIISCQRKTRGMFTEVVFSITRPNSHIDNPMTVMILSLYSKSYCYVSARVYLANLSNYYSIITHYIQYSIIWALMMNYYGIIIKQLLIYSKNFFTAFLNAFIIYI